MSETAIIIGVGAYKGVGAAVGRRFAKAGIHVILAGRTEERLAQRASEIRENGGSVSIKPTDVRKPEDICTLFDTADSISDRISSVTFNPGANVQFSLADTEEWIFEHLWRVSTFGGFLVARECARRMVKTGGGSILFTGATASIRGASGFAAFSSSKAGLRSVAQSMAREYGPQKLHVAHVIVDGAIDGDKVRSGFPGLIDEKGEGGALDVDAIAETFWQIHIQPPSAWSFELDLRPFKEPF